MIKCKTCAFSIENTATFCSYSGAKHITKRLTLKSLAYSLWLAITNLDFPFFNSLKNLIIKPEAVTLDFINGVRKKYSSPIHFTLIIMSIYGFYQYFNSDFLELAAQKNALSGFQTGWDSFPNEGQGKSDPKLGVIIDSMQKHSQFLIFLVIPVLAFINSKLHRKLGYNLAEHLVIALYGVSLSILATVILGLFWTPFLTIDLSEVYIYCSLFIQITTIAWVVYRSLPGAYFKHFLALIFTSIIHFFVFGLVMIFSLIISFLILG